MVQNDGAECINSENQAVETPDVDQRLWGLLRLRPARKVAEWALAEQERFESNHDGFEYHMSVAAALDPDYKNSREIVIAANRGIAPKLAAIMSRHPGELWNGYPNSREIALTFDDGPNAHTQALIDALVLAKAPATFFVVGNSGRKNRHRLLKKWRQMDLRWKTTHSHILIWLSAFPAPLNGQILRANVVIRSLTGRYLTSRPPGGDSDWIAHSYFSRLRAGFNFLDCGCG